MGKTQGRLSPCYHSALPSPRGESLVRCGKDCSEYLGRPTTPRRYNGRAPGRAYCKFQPTAHEMNSADPLTASHRPADLLEALLRLLLFAQTLLTLVFYQNFRSLSIPLSNLIYLTLYLKVARGSVREIRSCLSSGVYPVILF